MHVLIIPSAHFLTAAYPLGGIFQFHQASSLHRAGYQVGVISPGVISSRFLLRRYPYTRIDRSLGYPVLRRYIRKFLPHRHLRIEAAVSLYQDLGSALYRSYVSRFGRPDVVHAHNIEHAGFIAQAIRRMDGVPYVITEHSSHFIMGRVPDRTAGLMKSCAREAGAITAVSSALANAIAARIAVTAVGVLPNVVDPFVMDSRLTDPPGTAGDIAFLNIASLDANKNQKSLLEAFAQQFKGARASLRIGGTGPLAGALKKLARRLGVADQVVFLGRLDRQAILRELQLADCLVLPSFHETFGVVLIEALACGRPVIATRSGGPEDFISEKSGLLVAPGDTVALGEAMTRMAQSRAAYRAAALRDECKARFGEAAFVATAARIYAEAMSRD